MTGSQLLSLCPLAIWGCQSSVGKRLGAGDLGVCDRGWSAFLAMSNLRKTFQEESSGEACVVDQLSCYLTGETTQPWIGSHRVSKSAGFGQRRCDMLRSTPHIRPSWKHENEAVDWLSMELENEFCMMLIRDNEGL
jgi:hypothetical protein